MNNYLQQVQDFLSKNSLDIAKDQFFCIDDDVFNQIVNSANISSNDRVLEVGPGLGFLTRKLAARAKEVIAIEIDSLV